MIRTIVSVDGMACGMCEAHINDAIRAALPVKKVTSSRAKKETVILSDESNLVVNDPKGELLESTRGLLDLLGYEVVSLDFRHPERSSGRFNPLDVAWNLWHQDKKDEAVTQLYDFAILLNLDLSQKTNDAYWPNASINMFVGIAVLLLEAGIDTDVADDVVASLPSDVDTCKALFEASFGPSDEEHLDREDEFIKLAQLRGYGVETARTAFRQYLEG